MLKGLWVLDFCVQLVLPDLSRGGVLPLNKVQLHLCCDNTACVCTECSGINKIPTFSKSYRVDNVIDNPYTDNMTSNWLSTLFIIVTIVCKPSRDFNHLGFLSHLK